MFPANLKLRGVALEVNDPRVSGDNFHQSYWLMASDNFAAWIQPQIDAAIGLGANAIYIICDTGNIVSGRYVDQATFIARVLMVADYCLSKGLYFFPTLSNGVEVGDENNLSLIAPLAGQLAASLSSRSNVIGFDLWAEIQGDIGQGQFGNTEAQSLLAQVRAAVQVVSTLPTAASVIVFTQSDWTSSVWSLVAPYCDFWLAHVYRYIPAASDPSALMASFGAKTLLVGEVGGTTAEGSQFQTAIYQAAGAISNLSDCVGAFAWALCDGPDTSGYGLLSGLPGSFSPRTQMTAPFSSWASSGPFNAQVSTVMNFKFGTQTSPAVTDYTSVNETTVFTAALGYGWLSGTIDSRDRGSPNPFDQSFDFTANGSFGVNLPNGAYQVTITCGDNEFPQGPMQVAFQGVQVDEFTTAAGVFTSKTYMVTVSNGQLILGLNAPGGTSPYAVINAMAILPALTTPAAIWPVTLNGSAATATAQKQEDGSWKIVSIQ